jgi:uncharacterized protein YcbX
MGQTVGMLQTITLLLSLRYYDNNYKMNPRIAGIYIYPIKSLGGIAVNQAYAEDQGFRYDRKWMLADGNNRFLTQRECPRMALFECNLTDEGISVKFQGQEKLVPFNNWTGLMYNVIIWDHKVDLQEVSPEISRWFSRHLNRKCRLLGIGELYQRKKSFAIPPFETDVSLADGYPYLILGTSSLDLLNSKLEEPLPFNRFRPNIFLHTETPHIEDEWKEIHFGETKVKIIKPCARCIITTINQETGIKNIEPIKTLSTYRLKDKNILFGANAMVLNRGMISMGDKVTAV